MVEMNFNVDEREDPQDFEVLPKGGYLVIEIDSEMKDTKKGDGKYPQFEFVVVQAG